MYTPTPEFMWHLSSVGGTRPSATWGTSVTPAQNTFTTAAWAEVFAGAAVVNDVWGVSVLVHANSVATAARDTLLNIGIDPAGGTSYSTIIPQLLVSCAGGLGTGGGNVCYYFPIRIPAGSSIAAQASVNNATVGTLRVIVGLFGLPRHPHLTRVGSYVTAIGTVAGSSRGTTVTVGTTSDGSWTSLGTPTKEHWYWQLGFGVNDSSMSSGGIYTSDLAFGNPQQMIIEDLITNIVSSAEALNTIPPDPAMCHRTVPANVEMFGRCQCSGTADSAISLAAYGVGG